MLGIWVQTSGREVWAGVLAELRNRGVKDVLIACCDGLTGFPEAIEATWSQTVVQTCVVHLIRASMRFVSYNDRKAVAAARRPIYTAPTEAAAAQELDIFEGSNWGKKYPATVRVWRDAWERFIPFLEFLPAVRKIIYTTNSRVAELPAAEDHQEPRPLSQRRRGGQAVVAGDPRHRGQARQGTGQGSWQAPQRTQGTTRGGRRCGRAGVERRLRRAQPRLPRPAGAGLVTGEARTAGFLPDQPSPAGAEPRSTHRPGPRRRPRLDRGEHRHTIKAGGTPPPDRRNDFCVLMIERLNPRGGELTPHYLGKINNPVYTADLTTSRRSDHAP